MDLVHQYVLTRGLDLDDPHFPKRLLIPPSKRPKRRLPLTPERIAEWGTFTAANGCTYRHGTVTGYVTGKCKCELPPGQLGAQHPAAGGPAAGT